MGDIKKPVRTHTFNGRKYYIDFVTSIEGVTDSPEKPQKLHMDLLDANNFKSFHSAMHEAMEASGFCDRCLHKRDGTVGKKSIEVAKFMWRIRDRFSP